MTATKNKKINIGPLLVFISALCFSTCGVAMKYVPWHAMAINSARNCLGILVLLVYLLATRHKIKINRAVLIGALAITLSQIFFMFANKLTTAGNAIILQFTAPVWVIIFSIAVFKKKPSKIDLTAVVLVFAGVLCFFIDGLSEGNTLGNVMAVASGMTYSWVFLMNEDKEADPISSTFISMMLNIVIGLPWLIRTDLAAATQSTWIALIVLGIVDVGLGYVLLAIGIQKTPAVAACLISGIEPIANPIWVALIYGEILTPLAFIGAAIVFVTRLIYNVKLAKTAGDVAKDEIGIA